jgi:hypothetical protein
MNLLGHLVSPMRKIGPYAAVALVVPGGSLIALSLWSFRRQAGSANPPRSGAVHRAIIRTTLAVFIAFIPLLASCAGPGLFNMSDEWCARHPDATGAHCPANQELAPRTASRD